MILYELVGGEAHPAYQALQVANVNRQYDFLRSIVAAGLEVSRPMLSSAVIKALNFHAITCLHTNAGEYRPCPVKVGSGDTAYTPPEHYRVEALMNDMVNMVNRYWDQTDDVVLATIVLWQLNLIHPFINGNGRTARAASYFVLCMKTGGWLRGKPILPELIKRERAKYVAALKHTDASAKAGKLDLSVLHALVSDLLKEQLAGDPGPAPDPGATPAA